MRIRQRIEVPERGRRKRAPLMRALALCAVLFSVTPALSQSLTGDLFNPSPGGFAPKQSGLNKIAQAASPNLAPPNPSNAPPEDDQPQAPPRPARLGVVPSFGTPAASGAAGTGYDSLGRKKKPKQLSTAPPSGAAARNAAQPLTGNAKLPPLPSGPVASTPPKISPPPSSTANAAPVPPSLASAVPGQPPRRRLKVDDDPFGAVGIYYGSFLSKAAVELSGGYDTNPARVSPGKGSALYIIAPELVVASNWERHSLTADLRGSYTGYGTTFPADISASSGVPTKLDRPDFNGRIDGRLDMTRDTHINSELRLRIATDNPGSPNIQTGLIRYPIYATSGATLGADHDFNRFNVALNGTIDHTSYQQSKLTDGTLSSNDDRNYMQYGSIARVSYDWRPGLKPFVEVEADTRIHEEPVDRYGYSRNSNGSYAKGGSTFELSRLITGEMAVGWGTRSYEDFRLERISGFLSSGSLIWTVTPLTTAKFIATSSIDESPLVGVIGVLSHNYTWQVDHVLRRWLIATARFGYGNSNYEGLLSRFDNFYTASADLVYKIDRTFQIKGQVRHDWLVSNQSIYNTDATIVTLGVRVQQ